MRYKPKSAGEVVDILVNARRDARSLMICGGESKRFIWRPAHLSDELTTEGMTGITSYDPDELVITAQAGTPLVEIEAALDARQQMLAFDPFDHSTLFIGGCSGRSTLGGIVATNTSGSRRISAGAARDHVLGFEAVSGHGEFFKGGGKVVKNVTGYDLPKLMTGSWGTLAVLTSLTLRLLPRPRSEKTLLVHGLSDEVANRTMTLAMGFGAAVAAAAHLPMNAVQNSILKGKECGLTALRVEGFGPSVEVRANALCNAFKHLATVTMIEMEESHAFWAQIRSVDLLPKDAHALWRISLPPADGWRLGSQIKSPSAHFYDWGGGLLWVAEPDSQAREEPRIDLHQLALSLGGHAKLIRANEAARNQHLKIDAADTPLTQLQRRVKHAFDPRGLLNPGVHWGVE